MTDRENKIAEIRENHSAGQYNYLENWGDVSEYLSKKAVLESIEEAYQTNLKSPYHTDWDKGFRSALRFMKRVVLSGEFDVPLTGGDVGVKKEGFCAER